MDRRHWMGLVGSGIGASVGGRAQAADGHGGDDKANGHASLPNDYFRFAIAKPFCAI